MGESRRDKCDKMPSEPAEPIIDRSTPAGKLMWNLYGRQKDKQRLNDIGRAHAPKPQQNPKPIVVPKPKVEKKKVAVPKFRKKSQYEFHPIDFVQGKKRQDVIAVETNDYQEEEAPSMGFVQSNEDRVHQGSEQYHMHGYCHT